MYSHIVQNYTFYWQYEDAKEYDLEIKKLNKFEVDSVKSKVGAGGDEASRLVSARPSFASAKLSHLGTAKVRHDVVDFRGCGCANIQAKISVELVKHYRKAGKAFYSYAICT